MPVTPRHFSLLIGALLLLPGCVPKMALSAASKTVGAAGKAADWATVSGDEADRERGRELRKRCKKDPDPRFCDKLRKEDARRDDKD